MLSRPASWLNYWHEDFAAPANCRSLLCVRCACDHGGVGLGRVVQTHFDPCCLEPARVGARDAGSALFNSGQVETSELWARIRLPPTDAKIMPPNSKPAMSLDEISVIKLWIAAGASGVAPVTAIRGAPAPIRRVTVVEIDTAVVECERAPLAATLKELQSRLPTVIGYESRGSADLEVNASLLGSAFGDRELAALAPLAERIVRLDLSGTAVSDASAALLRAMSRLRAVRLMHTKVTEAALMPLRTRGMKIYAEALTA